MKVQALVVFALIGAVGVSNCDHSPTSTTTTTSEQLVLARNGGDVSFPSPPAVITTSATNHEPLGPPKPWTTGQLAGKKVALLATDGFDETELVLSRKMFADEGAQTVLVAPKSGTIQGYKHGEPGSKAWVDLALDQANVNDFDALILPGGAASADELRMNPTAVALVRSFAKTKRPVAAICQGPSLLVEARVVSGHTVTSWPSLRTDLNNAGATWVDRPVVDDRGLVTSRKPEDIAALVKATIAEILQPQALGKHAMR